MGMVLLRSRVGPVEFRRRVRTVHENGVASYDVKDYRFTFDNDFRQAVPSQVWDELADEYFGRDTGKRYRELFQVSNIGV